MWMTYKEVAIPKKDATKFKGESTTILSESGFSLHKWHSNEKRLNSSKQDNKEEETYAKRLVGNRQASMAKILVTWWNKKEDTHN